MPKCRRRMTSVRSIVCTDRLRPIADRLCWSSACLCNHRPPRKAPLSHSANLVRLFELQTLPHSVQTSSASSRSALRTRSKLAAYGAPTASPVSVAHLASRFVCSLNFFKLIVNPHAISGDHHRRLWKWFLKWPSRHFVFQSTTQSLQIQCLPDSVSLRT